ncbi:MAG: hypothetical protein ACXWWC_14575 [Chitinophagaceae bacterium]
MDEKEYLILQFLSRFNSPIPFDELEKGLEGKYDKGKKNESLLADLSNLEFKGMLIDNYAKGIQISELGKKQIAPLNLETEKIEYSEKKIVEETEYGPKITKFVYRTYWVMFAITIISLIISLLSLAFLFLRRY